MAAKKAKTKKAKTAKPEPTAEKPEGRGRAAKFAPDATIRVLVEENPKRAGSASRDRFDLYVDKMTVAEALEAGVGRGDLTYDVAHEFISIK